MGVGLLFTAVFVCLPMIVNYQNFRRPVGHQLGPAAALCGIVRMLYVTDTSLNVPSLIAAIVAVGVASGST